MQRLSNKGPASPNLSHDRDSQEGNSPLHVSAEASNRFHGQNLTMMGESDSQILPHPNYAEENTTNCDVSHKKKEKFGIFRNLRRRLRSNFQKKSEQNQDVQSIEECQESTSGNRACRSKAELKRHKHSGKCRMNLCNKPSNSNSSQSSESLDLNIHCQNNCKINELLSNCDIVDSESRKEKASCKTKDISRFQIEGRVFHGYEIDKHSASDSSSDRKNRKISNLSPSQTNSSSCGQSNISNGVLPYGCDRLKSSGHSVSESSSETEPPKMWSLTHELFRLSKYGWYWGPITRREAEKKLAGQPDGAFLVRDSSDERYLLSLSFRSYGRTLHTRIEHCNGKFIFDAQPDTEGYPSIVDLIENSMNDPQTGICSYSRRGSPSPPIYPVRLTRPVSRFTQVRSLQYLCRFVIRQYTRYDHIQELPLPTSIKGWISENQYLGSENSNDY